MVHALCPDYGKWHRFTELEIVTCFEASKPAVAETGAIIIPQSKHYCYVRPHINDITA